MRASALVVTHDHAASIGVCLESLHASTLPPAEVFVLDHASTDGTVDAARRARTGAVVLEYRDNPGFGTGVNRGRRAATGDLLLLLNPDATVAPDAIERLAAALEASPEIAAVGPKVLLPDAARRTSAAASGGASSWPIGGASASGSAGRTPRISSAGLRVNRVGYACDRGCLEVDSGQYDTPADLLAVSGCALLVRAAAFDRVGGFDPAYFLYYEDLDLCWRLWLAGGRVRYEPTAVAYHRAAQDSTGVLRHHHDHRNRLRTLIKNCGATTLLRLAAPVVGFELLSLAALAVHLRIRPFGWRLLADLATIATLPSALNARGRIQRSRRADEQRLFEFLVPEYGNPPPPAAKAAALVAGAER